MKRAISAMEVFRYSIHTREGLPVDDEELMVRLLNILREIHIGSRADLFIPGSSTGAEVKVDLLNAFDEIANELKKRGYEVLLHDKKTGIRITKEGKEYGREISRKLDLNNKEYETLIKQKSEQWKGWVKGFILLLGIYALFMCQASMFFLFPAVIMIYVGISRKKVFSLTAKNRPPLCEMGSEVFWEDAVRTKN